MNVVSTPNVAIPSTQEDQERLRKALDEICNSMTRMDAERDHIKNILADMKERYDIPPKYLRRVARVQHKANYVQETQDNEVFEELHETLYKS